jgi:hypothetical protein
MRSSSISCSSVGHLGLVTLFLLVLACGVASAEIALRAFISGRDSNILQRRVAAIYDRKEWSNLGDSALANVLIGDSQMYWAFYQHPGFFQLAIHGESTLMLEILAREYFRFGKPGRIVLPVGPQLFGGDRFALGSFHYDTYFAQNNWIQHALGIHLYITEPGIANVIGELVQSIARERTLPSFVDPPDMSVPRPPPKLATDWSDNSTEQRERLAAARALSQTPMKGFETSPHFAAYARMAASLASRGATLCFLRPPLTPEYLRAIEGNGQFSLAYSKFRELATRYGDRYVDFKNLHIPYDATDFLNQDHLTPIGSTIFAPLALKACFD